MVPFHQSRKKQVDKPRPQRSYEHQEMSFGPCTSFYAIQNVWSRKNKPVLQKLSEMLNGS